jgi:lysozyme
MTDKMRKERNYLKNACMFVCGLVIGGTLVYLINGNKTKDTEDTATSYGNNYPQVYGVDVSFWQGMIHWDQLSLPCDDDGFVSGKIPAPRNQRPVQFAFIRVTKSDSLVDSLYHKNYNEAKKLGIPCGAYHFLTDTVSGKTQAEAFLSHVRLEPGDLPPVLDVEIDSPEIVTKAKEWLEIVENVYEVKAIIYTNMHVYEKWIKNDSMLNTHDLWLAKPRDDMPDVPNCKFWQFTHEGHIWGIIDNVVDINLFNGTQEELQEYINTKGIKAKV